MSEYKALDSIIGASHYNGTFVSAEVEAAITARLPPTGEYLSGRIVPLYANKMMLILIFELLPNRAIKASVNVPVKLLKQDAESTWFDYAH